MHIDNLFLQRCTDVAENLLTKDSKNRRKICVLLLPDEEEYLVSTHQIDLRAGVAGIPCFLCNDEADLEVISGRLQNAGYEIIRPASEELEGMAATRQTEDDPAEVI